MKEELTNLGIGLAAVEAGPAAAESVFDNLADATGAKLEFLSGELPEGASHFLHSGIETAQAVAPAVAITILCYYGFRHMLGGKDKPRH